LANGTISIEDIDASEGKSNINKLLLLSSDGTVDIVNILLELKGISTIVSEFNEPLDTLLNAGNVPYILNVAVD
jgi:hypothetical protein